MKTVKAKIIWLFSKKRIPCVLDKKEYKTCNSYSPMIVFKNQYNKEDHVNDPNYPSWSSVIFNESIKGKESISTVTYLVEKAPFELLQVGAEFELYEGANKVADGIVIEELE